MPRSDCAVAAVLVVGLFLLWGCLLCCGSLFFSGSLLLSASSPSVAGSGLVSAPSSALRRRSGWRCRLRSPSFPSSFFSSPFCSSSASRWVAFAVEGRGACRRFFCWRCLSCCCFVFGAVGPRGRSLSALLSGGGAVAPTSLLLVRRGPLPLASCGVFALLAAGSAPAGGPALAVSSFRLLAFWRGRFRGSGSVGSLAGLAPFWSSVLACLPRVLVLASSAFFAVEGCFCSLGGARRRPFFLCDKMTREVEVTARALRGLKSRSTRHA